jgi:hypothetical protein
MRKIDVFFCLLLAVFSCQEKKKTPFLQEEEVQLVQPNIIVSNTIIDSLETITAELLLDGVVLYYTDNGEAPSRDSNKYEKPIQVVKPGVFKFKSFHPVLKSSAVSSIKIYKKGLIPKKITWHSKEPEKYKGVGDLTLINNKKASLEFSNMEWQGFETIASATVFFKELTTIKSIKIGYLCDTASWIFPPESVSVLVFFKDGTSKEIVKKTNILEKQSSRTKESIQIPIEMDVVSLKIKVSNVSSIPDWHEGRGLKAWLFMDEWIFN